MSRNEPDYGDFLAPGAPGYESLISHYSHVAFPIYLAALGKTVPSKSYYMVRVFTSRKYMLKFLSEMWSGESCDPSTAALCISYDGAFKTDLGSEHGMIAMCRGCMNEAYVSHECVHATHHYLKKRVRGFGARMNDQMDSIGEWMAWTQGELVRQLLEKWRKLS